MSRFGSTSYNPSGSTSDTEDYKERDSILLGKYAILSAEIDSVGVYDGNWGLNMILNFDNAEVVEGVVGNRIENADDEQDDKTKIMGWDRWYDRNDDMELVPFEDGGEISTDELGRRVTEEYGGDTYKYEIEDGILEEEDEPAEIGDVELWLSNGKKARTLAKVLSQKGHDIIEDKEDDRHWLNAADRDTFQLREELEGRRIMFWFEQTTLAAEEIDDLDEDVTFTDAVILDAETEAPITIPNDADGGESGDSGEEEADTESETDEADTEEEDFPRDVDELIDMFARTGQDERGSVEELVLDEAPEDYEVDMDAVMGAIESRM
jgi:hypothetical protein